MLKVLGRLTPGVLALCASGCYVLIVDVRAAPIDPLQISAALAPKSSSPITRSNVLKVQTRDGASVVFRRGVTLDGGVLTGTAFAPRSTLSGCLIVCNEFLEQT